MKYVIVALCLGPLLGALLIKLSAASGVPIGPFASVFGGPTERAQTLEPVRPAGPPVATAPTDWATATAAATSPTAPAFVQAAPIVPAVPRAEATAPVVDPRAALQAPAEMFAPAAQPSTTVAAPTATFASASAPTAPDAFATAAPAQDAPADLTAPAMNAVADALVAYGPAPAPLVDPRRFTEAHWQGIEVIPKTARLAKMLGLPADAQGVVMDDVTLPADLQGFQAGDLVVSVGQVPTPDLVSFIQASDRVRDRRRVEVEVIRGGQAYAMVLSSLLTRLGNANGETPPMIPPGARMPHGYQGACTSCHRIGTTGTLPVDQGDAMTKTAPAIRSGSRCPHRDRGACSSCHDIVP